MTETTLKNLKIGSIINLKYDNKYTIGKLVYKSLDLVTFKLKVINSTNGDKIGKQIKINRYFIKNNYEVIKKKA